ncbi:FAD:protein FMN transferase [Aneurinibacillus aneurinilyticus]|uniref:FAD:protein FMN transferase n=1 Tax=Aneurinibacillus aneurinilyticus TaxID=1391 RepID=A0A848D3G0_ANEAE|nr:FAD:protein FMN transferase [Aneurinibacillus aneurinilyticus]NMF01330.1 FAD:protein FMN transferase [Aneurinibacillus aneurinilyticus]
MHTFQAMNTEFSTIGLTQSARKEIEWLIRIIEARLSRFLSDSELSRLNRSAGKPVSVSAPLYEVLEQAHAYYCETDGFFNPYLGAVVSGLGYNQSFETLSTTSRTIIPTKVKHRSKCTNPLMLDRVKQTVRLHPDVLLDLGGIAKGWSARFGSSYLIKKGVQSGLIDAGGDIAVWGTNQGAPWGISIADPFCPNKDLASFWLRHDTGVATSNCIKRSWLLSDGSRAHHIIDPRTFNSAVSDLVQVTVLAPDVLTADVYAKAMLILGFAEGVHWMQERKPELAYVQVRSDGSVHTGGNIEAYCIEWEGRNQCQI